MVRKLFAKLFGAADDPYLRVVAFWIFVGVIAVLGLLYVGYWIARLLI